MSANDTILPQHDISAFMRMPCTRCGGVGKEPKATEQSGNDSARRAETTQPLNRAEPDQVRNDASIAHTCDSNPDECEFDRTVDASGTLLCRVHERRLESECEPLEQASCNMGGKPAEQAESDTRPPYGEISEIVIKRGADGLWRMNPLTGKSIPLVEGREIIAMLTRELNMRVRPQY